MSKKITFILVVMLVLAGGSFLFDHLPKHFWTHAQLTGLEAVWHGDEVFVILGRQTQGRASTVVGEKFGRFLPKTLRMFQNMPDAVHSEVSAFHVSGGQVNRQLLPGAQLYDRFIVYKGSPYLISARRVENRPPGYRWTGTQFDTINDSEAAEVRKSVPTAEEHTEDADDEDGYGALDPASADHDWLVKQGWQSKFMAAYAVKDKSHSIKLAHSELSLNLRAFSKQVQEESRNSGLYLLVSAITLSGPALTQREEVLFQTRPEWERVDEAKYRALTPFGQSSGQTSARMRFFSMFFLLSYLLPALPVLLYFYNLFAMKRKVLKSMPSGFAFPPMTPEQFGKLDQEALRRFTADFESLGFSKLMDFSLVPQSGMYIPGFSRLMVNADNRCFVEIFQVFPPNKNPIPMTIGINSYLDDGWSLSSGIRKTTAMSYMMRLPKALWISQPGASAGELLRVHLERRHQITSDLGIRVLADMSPTTYFDFVGKRNEERRANLKKKNFAVCLGSALAFKLRPKREWMGDYAKQVAFRREPWKSPVSA